MIVGVNLIEFSHSIPEEGVRVVRSDLVAKSNIYFALKYRHNHIVEKIFANGNSVLRESYDYIALCLAHGQLASPTKLKIL